MANEDQTNLALISALSASIIQPSLSDNKSLISVISVRNIQLSSTELVVQPPSVAGTATGVTDNPHALSTIATAEKYFLTTNVKL